MSLQRYRHTPRIAVAQAAVFSAVPPDSQRSEGRPLTRLESNHYAKRKRISFVFKSLHKKEGGGVRKKEK